MPKTITSETIILLMFMIIPIDMINGIMLKNNISLPLSIAQLYKLILLFFVFVGLLFNTNKLILSVFLFSVLLIPSIFQVLVELKIGFLLNDLIKITRYLTPVFAFLFFTKYIKNYNRKDLLLSLIKFSFIIFSGNILLKYIGLGYPIYPYGDIGSKGFFYAGNEASVVLIILSSIIGYELWINSKYKKYVLLFLFTLFVGITISSKTGVLGVVLTFILIPIKPPQIRIKIKKLNRIFFFFFFFFPILVVFLSKIIISSPVFLRLHFFWKKLDIVTFFLSNRNNFFADALKMYKEKYSFLEKTIGTGQTKYERLNGNSIVEIDIADVFFAYGFIGLILFLSLLTFIWYKSRQLKRQKTHPYSGLVKLMFVILFFISTIAGHVYSSGMAAIFIGLLFSLMYIDDSQVKV